MSKKILIDEVIERYEIQLIKAIGHFEYSLKKVEKLTTNPTQQSEDELALFESFSSRFSRVVDLFLSKYLKARVKKEDPGFDGTLRDFVNFGEKLGLVEDADTWMSLRELRNIEAHTYEDELEEFLKQLLARAPILQKIQKVLAPKKGKGKK